MTDRHPPHLGRAALLILGWLLLAGLVQAQPRSIRFRPVVDDRDRVYGSAVRFLFQDARGYVWYRTDTGLHRHDGRNTIEVVVREDDEDISRALPSDYALAPDGSLYFATRFGIRRYSYHQGGCVSPPRPTPASFYSDIEFDGDGRLWVVLDGQLRRAESAEATPEPVVLEPAIELGEIRCLWRDRSGRMWIGDSEGRLLAVRGDRIEKHFDLAFLPKEERFVIAMSQSARGAIYARTSASILAIDEAHQRLERLDPVGDGGNFLAFLEDRGGRHWYGTDRGLWLLDEYGLQNFKAEADDLFSLPDSRVSGLLEDESGAIWVSTYRGIARFDGRLDRFRFLAVERGETDERKPDIVATMMQDWTGRSYMSSLRGGLTVYLEGDFKGRRIQIPNDGAPPNVANKVIAMAQLADGAAILATQGRGLHVYFPSRDQLREIPLPPEMLDPDSPRLTALAARGDGRCWVGSRRHLALMDADFVFRSPVITVSEYAPGKPDRILPGGIALLADGGAVAIGAKENVLIAGADGRERQRFSLVERTAGRFSGRPRSITVDPDGDLLIAASTGLLRVDRQGRVEALPSDGDWPPSETSSILLDSRGKAWISLRRHGLVELDPRSGHTIALWDRAQGLHGTEFYLNARWRSDDGKLLAFGGFGGAVFFRPDALARKAPGPRVEITNLAVPANADLSLADVGDNERLVLRHDESDLLLEFAALDFIAPESTEFAYRIAEEGDAWVRCGHSTTAGFVNLAPGEHTIEIKARNADGIWSSEPVRLVVEVVPAFWQTRRFTWSILLLGFGLVAVTIQARFAAVHRQNRALADEIGRRQVVENALRENRERLEAVFDAVPYDFWQADASGVYRYQNEVSIARWGDKRGQLLPGDLAPPEIGARWRAQFERALAGESIREEVSIPLFGGDLQLIELVSPLVIGDEVCGVYGLAIDITRLRSAEREARALDDQLRQSQKMEAMGLLAGGVAHDFNNILTGILGSAELGLRALDLEPPSVERARHDLVEIRSCSRRAKDITGQLLSFSRQEAIGTRIIELDRVVRGLRTFIRSVVRDSVQVDFDLEVDIPPVHADPTRIEQVILNLVMNAATAIEQVGRITIALRSQRLDGRGDFAVLAVHDDGVGMSTELQERIFAPFFSGSKDRSGTGLGLATSNQAIEEFGGWFEVTSAPGEGSTFEVWLPAYDPNTTTTRYGRAVVMLHQESVANLVRAALEEVGYEVSISMGLEDVLEAFSDEGEAFSLIVSDARLLQRQTGRLLARLRTTQPRLGILVLLGPEEDARGAAELGVADYEVLRRPFAHAGLMAAIRRFRGRRTTAAN